MNPFSPKCLWSTATWSLSVKCFGFSSLGHDIANICRYGLVSRISNNLTIIKLGDRGMKLRTHILIHITFKNRFLTLSTFGRSWSQMVTWSITACEGNGFLLLFLSILKDSMKGQGTSPPDRSYRCMERPLSTAWHYRSSLAGNPCNTGFPKGCLQSVHHRLQSGIGRPFS